MRIVKDKAVISSRYGYTFDAGETLSTVYAKVSKSETNIYGELVDSAAPKPTIRFGVNGSNAAWGTELPDDMSNAYRYKLTFIKDMANIAMSQISCNESFIIKIKEVAKHYPIFDTYKGCITKIDKTYTKIVANWICHFIDPSILCTVSIQDMIVFLVYQFGYIDNLKPFIHYGFSSHKDSQICDNNEFICSEYDKDLHFLDKRCVPTNPIYSNVTEEFVMDSLNGYYGFNGFVDLTDPVMDLVEVVTSCCNRYYFEYGWHFHYPDFELLSTCEIPEYPWNTYAVREKLGLSNKKQKDLHKTSPTLIPLMDIECIRSHMKCMYTRTQRYSLLCIFSIVYAIFERFIHQTKSNNEVLSQYDMVTFTDKYLSSDYQIPYNLYYNDTAIEGMRILHFASPDVRYIQNRYMINHVHIMPEMKFNEFWPTYYDCHNVMDQMCTAILNSKKPTAIGRGYTKN